MIKFIFQRENFHENIIQKKISKRGQWKEMVSVLEL